MGFPGGSVVKDLPANAGDMDWIPGLARSPGGVHGNALQYSSLENPTDFHFFLFMVAQMVKASAYNARDLGSIPGSGRSPREGNGNSLQYSCLENPMDGRAWWATVHGVSKSQT